jgi:hypothetical protein
MGNQQQAGHDIPTQIAREALRELLSIKERHAASLKLQMLQQLHTRGIAPSDVFGAFPKFSAFLAAHSDIVDVQPGSLAGDVVVRLRRAPQQPELAGSIDLQVRGEVWRAFTNPDPRRRRFIDRRTGELRHFHEAEQHANDKAAAAKIRSEPNFIEVDFIPAHTHSAWMKEFLQSTTGLPDWSKQSAMHFLAVPYETSLDFAFTKVLGPFGEAWRRFRGNRITAAIQKWAEAKGVPFDKLLMPGTATVKPEQEPMAPVSSSEPNVADQKSMMSSILDECSEDELSRIMLPASVVLRILRQSKA